MTVDERNALKHKVTETFEHRLNSAMKELSKYCVTNGLSDDEKALLLGFAKFLKFKMIDILDDYYD